MDQSTQKTRILVIDDDRRMRELMREFLNDEGFEVSLSENGLEGLDDAKELHPDLILLDLWLPGRSGEEVCKAIRGDDDERFRCTPILMVTGKDSDVDQVLGMVIGATGYLSKPFPMSVLLKEIQHCLDKKLERVEGIEPS